MFRCNSQLVSEDYGLFQGLFQDLFPNTEIPENNAGLIQEEITNQLLKSVCFMSELKRYDSPPPPPPLAVILSHLDDKEF